MTTSAEPPAPSAMEPETRRGIVSWTVKAAVGWAGYAAILFLSAGTLRWLWGWVLLLILALMLAAHPILLLPRHPELLAERGKGTRAAGVKAWDKWLTAAGGGLMIAAWVVAGLDFRAGWTAPWPLWVHLLGAALTAGGYAIFMWAMAANPFFAEGVRIQTERGHTAQTGGPYRFVRHPGYAGGLLAYIGTPLLLGSWWAFIPTLLLIAVWIARTALEDRTLRAELPGYDAYARRTRYRLIPGVW